MLFDDAKDVNEEETETLDIPDFVEDKDEDEESSSIDMSIFNMSDDELYDDEPTKDDEEETFDESLKPKRKKKSNSSLIICLIIIILLLASSVVAFIYALNEHKNTSTLNAEITQLKTLNADLQTRVDTYTKQIDELNAQIEQLKNSGGSKDPSNKYVAGTKLVITKDGDFQGVKTSASKESDTAVDSEGNKYILYEGDTVTLLEDATIDSNGNYWAKVAHGYMRIIYNGETWAKVVE